MTALAKSQDKMGWRNLMEGRSSKHLHKMQSIHLPFGSIFLNGQDWAKKTISKVLQITQPQWMYCNFSLQDKRKGYLRKHDMNTLMVKIKTLLDTRSDEIQFLLEFDHGKLARSNIHDNMYWVVAMEAAIIADQRIAATGARGRRMHNKHRKNMTRRASLRAPEAEERIHLDRFTYRSNNGV